MSGGELRDRVQRLGDLPSTAILTLACRARESGAHGVIDDPMAEEGLAALLPSLSPSGRPLHRRIRSGRIEPRLVEYVALRARRFDRWASDFARTHVGATIVNMGSGLDTRFWRIDDGALRLIDVDLPEMVELKQALLPDGDRQRSLACSVSDPRWMDEVGSTESGPFLFLAEGLFMYLDPSDVRGLVRTLVERFPGSELALETVHARVLRAPLRQLTELKLRGQLGLGRDARFRFGLECSEELCGWDPRLRLLEEWSYLDETRLRALRALRRWSWLRRFQWCARYRLGDAPEQNQNSPAEARYPSWS